MRLLKAKVRGQGDAPNTPWLSTDRPLTLIRAATAAQARQFTRLLATINPLDSAGSDRPFTDFPETVRQNGHLRRIIAAKYTAAIALFDTSPPLVEELGRFSPHLYEADRVEIGRRLDWSRWANFVELPSSARFADIADDLAEICRHLGGRRGGQSGGEELEVLAASSPQLRLKGELRDRVLAWLDAIPQDIAARLSDRLDRIRDAAMRIDHFTAARSLIYRRLPLTFLMQPNHGDELTRLLADLPPPRRNEVRGLAEAVAAELGVSPANGGGASAAAPLLDQAALAIAASREMCRSEPILLIAAADDDDGVHPGLLTALSAACQVVCVASGERLAELGAGRPATAFIDLLPPSS